MLFQDYLILISNYMKEKISSKNYYIDSTIIFDSII